MATYNGRILFIDGFAGPGRYSGGEEGSPLIALKTLLDHPHFQRSHLREREVVFIFIERDGARAAALKRELKQLDAARPTPSWIKIELVQDDFANAIAEELGALEKNKKHLAPTFAFVDPFGFSNVPLEAVARIAHNLRCECLITFMYEAITRFLGHPEASIQGHFDELFGTDEWSLIVNEHDPNRRRDQITELYRRQLVQKAGFRFVRTFEMINEGNRTEYFLYFGTNNRKGLSAMKVAMWRADPTGGQMFSDRTDTNQMVLLQPTADLAPLRGLLLSEFRNGGPIPIERVMAFVLEQTPYSEVIHLKKRTLQVMEQQNPPLIEVRRPQGKRQRPGEYPPGTTINFL